MLNNQVCDVFYDLFILSYATVYVGVHIFCFFLILYARIDALSLVDISLETLPHNVSLISLLGVFAKGAHTASIPICLYVSSAYIYLRALHSVMCYTVTYVILPTSTLMRFRKCLRVRPFFSVSQNGTA